MLAFDATAAPDELLASVLGALAERARCLSPLATWGGLDATLDGDDLARGRQRDRRFDGRQPRDPGASGAARPDRVASRAGELTWRLIQRLEQRSCRWAILPALGTHRAMDDDDADLLFGGHLDASELLVHDWRHGVGEIGRLGADEVVAVSGGLLDTEVVVEVASALLERWDLVISLGQVLPHEVVGMAGYSKNLVVGLGGSSFIGASHLLGALVGVETIIGDTATPVRDLVDTAFDRMLAPLSMSSSFYGGGGQPTGRDVARRDEAAGGDRPQRRRRFAERRRWPALQHHLGRRAMGAGPDALA